MLATREKHLPHVSHQSSIDAHDDFIDELPEKSEPNVARPIPENKTLPEPKKDIFNEDDDWGTAPKH